MVSAEGDQNYIVIAVEVGGDWILALGFGSTMMVFMITADRSLGCVGGFDRGESSILW